MQAQHSHNFLSAISVYIILAFSFFSACNSKELSRFSSPPATPGIGSGSRININTASEIDLQRIPGIGPSLAKKIIEHRTIYGSFRRPEHILIVEGISENRFHEFRDYILIE
jgi:competence ComEA-like helix-hairpin-helix protein